MLFQTFTFVFMFLPVTLLLYWASPNRTYKLSVLTVASYFFYGYWDWRFCGLLLLTSVVDFVIGERIFFTATPFRKKAWLTLSIVSNLTILGFFKYWDFFADSTNRLLEILGVGASAPLFHIILPVGISFYTFQSMSYTIDVYRGQTQPTRSLLKFLAFVSLFPQLVMGPIVRWTELDEQLDNLPRQWNHRAAALGASFFIVGLFKKIWLSDRVFPLVDPGMYHSLTVLEFWPAYLLWSFWLYFDFSSYSDMAVGLGLLLGIKFPQNFDSPFKAESPSEVWRRWHMTLSRWMRDYVFFSIGGSKKGFLRTLINIMIVYFLIGLWHGANWNMVGFGVYHGLAMIVEQVGRRLKIKIPTVALRRGLVLFYWTNSGWLFRSSGYKMTTGFYQAGFGANGLGTSFNWLALALVIACILHSQLVPNTWEWKWRFRWWEALALAALFITSLAGFFVEHPFFYFQF